MCEHAQHGHARGLRQAIDNRMRVGGPEAKTIHAGVHLDEHFDRARQRRALQHFYLFHMVYYNGQPARGNFGQFVRRKKSLEEQDPADVVTVAQRHRGVELEQCQAVGFRECRKNAIEAVSVRVGFDDRQHLCVRSMLARFGEIRAQRRKIDLGNEWA